MKNKKDQTQPFYRTGLFWQSVCSLVIFPLTLLPSRLGAELGPDDGWVLGLIMIVTFGVIFSALWSYSRLAIAAIERRLVLSSFFPTILSSASLYMLVAVMIGLPPFSG